MENQSFAKQIDLGTDVLLIQNPAKKSPIMIRHDHSSPVLHCIELPACNGAERRSANERERFIGRGAVGGVRAFRGSAVMASCRTDGIGGVSYSAPVLHV